MKRAVYSFFNLTKCIPVFLFAILLAMTSKGQTTYTISFPFTPPAVTDGLVNQNDGRPIETGVRFRVTQSGVITALRYYVGSSHTGTHIAHLWTNSGTLLATATVDAGTGWQEATLATPVRLTPGSFYVASVYNADGYYGAENNTWADQGGADYGTDPIRVIAYSNDPSHNGIYLYDASGFPTSDGTSDNYWVDVRFQPDFLLPVSLSEFRATTTQSDVALSWKTTSEINNRGFEIQRSNNNTDWYALNFVNGAGESNSVRNYNYADKGLAPGIYYYRLKQTDHDGKSKLSSIVSATVSGKGRVSLFQNFPNPFSGTTNIRYDLPNAQQVKLSIFDMMGREVRVIASKMSEAGSHQVSFDTKGLSRQLYSIRLKTESGVVTRQILVQ